MKEKDETNSAGCPVTSTTLLSQFYGMPVYISEHVVNFELFRFPKSKKFRIRKKWSKRKENQRFVPGMLMADRDRLFGHGGKCFYIHPALVPKLEDAIKRKNEAYDRKWR
jgi:hypothetical protein